MTSSTGIPSRSRPAHTTSTSSSPALPRNTVNAASKRRAPSLSNSWLHAMVLRRVCCRSGRSRLPQTSKPSEWSRRSSTACGVRSFVLAAASSMASGSPSSRRAMPAMAAASAPSAANPGVMARARVRKSAVDSHASSAAFDISASRSGTGIGGTGSTCSPVRRNGARLVTTMRVLPVAASSSATTAAPLRICSKLSSTSNTLRLPRYAARCSTSGRPRASCRPRPCAITDGTSVQSRIAASATK